MHRSGTSALTRMLGLLGIDLPATPLGGNEWNVTGHWEPSPVVSLNERILGSLGTTWDDWRPIDAGWHRSQAAATFKNEALDILRSEFNGTRPFVLKEPRICRLAAFWRDVLAGMGVTPLFVLPIRNPLEVAASLQVRDKIDPSLGHLLWMRHLLEAEFATRGQSRVFTTYDDLLGDWRLLADKMQAELDLPWPRSIDEAAGEIDVLLSDKHRHHRQPSGRLDQLFVPGGLSQAFEITSRWVRFGENEQDLDTLDSIRDGFDKATFMLSAAIASASNDRRKASDEQAIKLTDMVEELVQEVRRKSDAEQAITLARMVEERVQEGRRKSDAEQAITLARMVEELVREERRKSAAELASVQANLADQNLKLDDLLREIERLKSRRPRFGWRR